MQLQAKTIPPCTLAYMRHTGSYHGGGIQQLWADFAAWRCQHGLGERRAYGFSLDDPSTTAPAKCRYDAAVEVDPGFQPDGAVQVRSFPGGRYACTPYTGTAQDIGQAWWQLYAEALPASGWRLRGEAPFELYGPDFVVDEKAGVFACWLCVAIEA